MNEPKNLTLKQTNDLYIMQRDILIYNYLTYNIEIKSFHCTWDSELSIRNVGPKNYTTFKFFRQLRKS